MTMLKVLPIAVLLVLGLACSEDDPVTPEELCIEFASAQPPGNGRVVSRLGADSVCAQAVVEIVATGINDVFALETVLTYDSDVASFVGFSTSNSFLASDGSDVAAVIDELVAGEITIGLSRVAATGVNITDTQPLLELFFVVDSTSSDTGDLALDNECLLGSEQPPQPKPGLTCSGGTLIVQ